MEIIDLSGKWLYRTDEEDIGLSKKWYNDDFSLSEEKTSECDRHFFNLPGSTCDNHIGKKQDWYTEYTKAAVRAPRERFEYVAPLWLQKKVSISEEALANSDILLFLERVNIASTLFIDGVQVGREIISLSAPHIYNLTGLMYKLTPGEHLFTLRIDNRDLLHFGDMASGYSIDTQGLWNGIIGRIELELVPKVRIEDVQVFPSSDGTDRIQLQVITISEQHHPLEVKNATLRITVKDSKGHYFHSEIKDFELFTTRQRTKINYNLNDDTHNNVIRWNEFAPELYTVCTELIAEDKVLDSHTTQFGLRLPHVNGKDLMLDDRRLSLRGTINCAQYPLTGYPPMDKATWLRHMEEIKSFGLNHIRFHAWCPPEAAFEAADELGLYLLVEMPMWMNRDICPYEVGDDPIHEAFYIREARQIRKFYGNHPSFLMFSNGNENMGDFALLEDLTTMVKSTDNRSLYTMTSNFDHPVHECEDYLSAFEMAHIVARIQFLHDKVGEGTFVNYNDVVEKVDVPVISFEVGQYCVYPDVDCVEDYTGAMMPVNFDIVRKMMKEKGVYSFLKDYIKASGDMAAKLYKEDIEAVLRTKHFGGIQLLSASDYTGQSTATVGIMDVFFRDKGVVEKEVWRGFCSEVVPLFEAKRIFTNNEVLEGKLSLYDFGVKPISNVTYSVNIARNGELWKEFSIQGDLENNAALSLPLLELTESSLLKITVSVEANSKTYTNFWNVFVYPEKEFAADRPKVISLSEFAKTVGRETVNTKYIPVFWSPVHFPSKDSFGGMINETHPALSHFPSGKYLDYQWKYLLEHGIGMDISGLNVTPIVEMVPNYVDNTRISPLFEAVVDNERVIVCGFDLSDEYITVKALKASL